MYKIEDIINKIHQADCLEFMKKIPDKSIDLVLTDPPYEIDFTPYNIKWNKEKNNFKKIENDNIEGFCLKWFPEVKRISKNFVIFGANNFIKYIPDNYGWLVWDKRLIEKADKAFGSPFELAITNLTKKYKIYRLQSGGVINPDSLKGNNEPRFHPTQKPIVLFEKIINDFSKENDLIFDPFVGVGTTMIACKRLKRNCIAVEISKEYCDIANERLKQENLF